MIKHPRLTRRRFLQGTAATVAAAALRPTPGISAGQRTLRIRSNRDIQILDPGWMIGGTEIDMQLNCLPTLAVFVPGDKLSWRPSDSVETFTQVDDLHYSFRLRPGMTWTNGFGEVTAEDVKYSFERIADPANKAPWKPKWEALQEVQITDKLSGVIVLKEPFAPLIYTTLCNGTGAIVCKKAVEAKGGKFTSEFPAQAGPYLIKQWQPKQYLDLARNPDWKGPAGEYESVRIVFIEDEKPAEAAFEAGELDQTGISLDSLTRYRKSPPANSKLFEMPGLWWTWMGLNTEHPKLKDIRVRKAIQYAVDADAVNQAAYAGAAARAHGVVPIGLLGYRPHSAFDKPDPAKAKALLAEAGVSDLSLELKTLNQTDRMTAAQVIQANLGEVGIKVEIIPMDSGPFWNLGVEKEGNDWKDLQMWIMRFGDSPDPSQMTQWYTSDQVGVWNWERWKSPEFDELHKKALVERDEQKRAAMYIRMQDIMEETGAYVWLVFEPVEVLHRADIHPAMLPGPQIYLPGFKSA
jgi:peptide/nickel transport system substrate-binding protein